jgi:hypothetical protein
LPRGAVGKTRALFGEDDQGDMDLFGGLDDLDDFR